MVAAARAAWKGFLRFGSVSFQVKVLGAVSEADRIHFRILNRKSKLPVHSAYIDEETDAVVPAENQIKGFETDSSDFLRMEPDEIKALKLTSDYTLDIAGFVPVDEIDSRYLEKPYYLVPADAVAQESFAVFREALKRKGVAARSCIVLYQRGREVLVQALGKGLTMTTLRTHNEMLAANEVFKGLGKIKADPEMIEIANLLISKKAATFDSDAFVDTYEDALIKMIEAKKSGKAPPKAVPKPRENVVNLADVLRKSLEKEGISAKADKNAAPKRKENAA